MLLCKYSKLLVDHICKHTKKFKITSEKHKNNKRKAEDEAKGCNKNIAKQASIISSTEQAESSSNLRREFNMVLLRTFARAKIQIEKTLLLRNFLVKYCRQGDASPTTVKSLRRYVNNVYENHYETVKMLISLWHL